jgi:streptomycin 6-kinase
LLLLHGDLHHHNVLSSGRGWLAIDPKGVIGPAGYEVGPFLVNPTPEFARRPDLPTLMERRVEILAEHLGLEQRAVRGWGLVYAVLSAWWTIEDRGSEVGGVMRCASVLAGR